MAEKSVKLDPDESRDDARLLEHARDLSMLAGALQHAATLLDRKLRLEGQVDMLERRVTDARTELQQLTERIREMKAEAVYAR